MPTKKRKKPAAEQKTISAPGADPLQDADVDYCAGETPSYIQDDLAILSACFGELADDYLRSEDATKDALVAEVRERITKIYDLTCLMIREHQNWQPALLAKHAKKKKPTSA